MPQWCPVQIPTPRGCKAFVAVGAIVSALAMTEASRAWAIAPPDLSRSTLTCSDADAGALIGGDDLTCSLSIGMAAGTESAEVSATVPLPDDIASATPTAPATYESATRVISFSPTVIGRMFASDRRTVQFRVTTATGLPIGSALLLVADVQAVGDIDQVEVHRSVTSNTLMISPPPADLADSALACEDENGDQLWPGDAVSCALDVVNDTGHEAAASVVASLGVAGGTWVSGGQPDGFGGTNFDTPTLGSIASGTSKSVQAVFQVPPTAVGGTTLTPVAFVTGSSSPSLIPIRVIVGHDPLEVSPGPAVLVTSSISCSDSDGGLLLAGDDLTCTVAVSPLAGYEGVDGATATIGIPAGAEYVSGGDDHDAGSITFGSSSLGHVDAGAVISALFHLKVTGVPGSVLQPAGTLTATSVPLGGPVTQELKALPLVVGAPSTPLAPVVSKPVETDTPAPDTPAPTVVASKSYKLRAKTIRIKMRRGHRRKSHLWKGSRRRTVFVKRYVVRTPKISGKVVKKVTVPRKGKNAPKRGKVRIKGTRLIYTVRKGKRRTDRFRYTVTDTAGKSVTGKVLVSWEKKKRKKR